MLKNISVKFEERFALKDISFKLSGGQTLCVIGSSGSGKTTLLKTLNKLILPSSGRVELFGEDIAELDGANLRRKIGFVLQTPALFPHWNCMKNAELVPNLLNQDKEKTRERIKELFHLVGLNDPRFLSAYPHELSGGEQQRVGIVRALASDPKLILYDEPFSALDAITRKDLQEEVLRLKRKLKKTTVFVTHDIGEAMMIGDLILVLQEGKLIQMDTAENLIAHPATPYVEQLITSASNA